MSKMLIDSHAHLDDDRFDKDRDEIIVSLEQNGVELVLNPGADFESSQKSVKLALQYSCIYAAVGCHPHDTKYMTDALLSEFMIMARQDKVIAIGEIGLDYYYDNSDRDTQKKWFRKQIALANELNLPFIVHDRDAHEDVMRIIKEEHKSNTRGIIHCYSGSVEMAREFIKMGFLIALGGPVTFKKSKTPKLVAKEIPLEYMLVETDSPYMAPEPNRGKRNEPAYVRYAAEEIALIKGMDADVVAEQTNKNFRKLFDL